MSLLPFADAVKSEPEDEEEEEEQGEGKEGVDYTEVCPGIDSWVEAIRVCTTFSRLHVLMGVLESSIKWEKSAENAVSPMIYLFVLCYIWLFISMILLCCTTVQ